jgi:hypothetical protein
VSKVQRKTKNDPQPTLSESFNSHPLFSYKQVVYNLFLFFSNTGCVLKNAASHIFVIYDSI